MLFEISFFPLESFVFAQRSLEVPLVSLAHALLVLQFLLMLLMDLFEIPLVPFRSFLLAGHLQADDIRTLIVLDFVNHAVIANLCRPG